MKHHFRHLGTAAVLLLGTASIATAGLDGKYSTKVEVDNRGSDGSIGWTLVLSKDGSAKLEGVRSGRLRYDSRNVEDLGEAFSRLVNGGKITISGSWSDEGDKEFSARLRTLKTEYGSKSVDADLGGVLRGSSLRIRDWDKEFYGDEPRFDFEKLPPHIHTGDALMAGAAIVALGAIVGNQDKPSENRNTYRRDGYGSSGYSSSGSDWLDYQTGGSGHAVFGRQEFSVSKIRVILNRNGDASITFWSDYGKDLVRGTWSRASTSEVRINISGRLCGWQVNGSGTASIRNNREVSDLYLSGDYGGRDNRWKSTFTSARG